MGLVKKASTLVKGLRRHRNDGRSSRRPKGSEVNHIAVRKDEKPSVPASDPRRLGLRPRKAVAVAPNEETDTMAQTIISHQNHDRTSHSAYQHSAMEGPRPIQLVEDNEDDVVEEEASDEYEEDEDEDDIDDSVAEDMKKLEESFKGISQKYRLINRIGEGRYHMSPRVSTAQINRVQEHFLLSTRPSSCFRERMIMMMQMMYWSRILILTHHPRNGGSYLRPVPDHGHPN
jgi:hypothetical protein